VETTKRGYTETLFGRKRYFPALKSRLPFLRASAERMVMNAPLQGTAADIIKIATRRVDEEIKKKGLQDKVFFLLAVHDELIYEVEESAVEDATKIIKEAMESSVDSKIPFSVGVSVGKNWGEMTPI